MFILFSCFKYMYKRHTADMQPYISFQKKYMSIYFVSFCIIAECFNELIHNLVKVHTKLCTQEATHLFRKTIFIQNRYSKDSILTYCCPSSTTSLKELCTAVSLKMILHSCQINAVLPYVRGLHKMMPLHGKIWFYARNVIFSKKMLHGAYIGGFEKKCQRPC